MKASQGRKYPNGVEKGLESGKVDDTHLPTSALPDHENIYTLSHISEYVITQRNSFIKKDQKSSGKEANHGSNHHKDMRKSVGSSKAWDINWSISVLPYTDKEMNQGSDQPKNPEKDLRISNTSDIHLSEIIFPNQEKYHKEGMGFLVKRTNQMCKVTTKKGGSSW